MLINWKLQLGLTNRVVPFNCAILTYDTHRYRHRYTPTEKTQLAKQTWLIWPFFVHAISWNTCTELTGFERRETQWDYRFDSSHSNHSASTQCSLSSFSSVCSLSVFTQFSVFIAFIQLSVFTYSVQRVHWVHSVQCVHSVQRVHSVCSLSVFTVFIQFSVNPHDTRASTIVLVFDQRTCSSSGITAPVTVSASVSVHVQTPIDIWITHLLKNWTAVLAEVTWLCLQVFSLVQKGTEMSLAMHSHLFSLASLVARKHLLCDDFGVRLFIGSDADL